MLKNNKIKGSATLIVIITSIIFMIYAESTYADVRHMTIMHDNYEKDILEMYNTKYNGDAQRLSIYNEDAQGLNI